MTSTGSCCCWRRRRARAKNGVAAERRRPAPSYTPDGKLATLTAVNSVTGDQVTQYVYGNTLADSFVAASTLLRAEIYPDSDNTADGGLSQFSWSENGTVPLGARYVAPVLGDGPSGVYNRVEYAYNGQGQIVTKKDQNGTVHEFVYDGLGRLTQDSVAEAGTGIDTSVLSIGTSYEVRGMPQNFTSYDNSAAGHTITRTVLAARGNPLQVFISTDDSGASDADPTGAARRATTWCWSPGTSTTAA